MSGNDTQPLRRQLATYLKPEVHEMVVQVATMEMRTVADYVRTLLLKDIRSKLGEDEYAKALKASGLLGSKADS